MTDYRSQMTVKLYAPTVYESAICNLRSSNRIFSQTLRSEDRFSPPARHEWPARWSRRADSQFFYFFYLPLWSRVRATGVIIPQRCVKEFAKWRHSNSRERACPVSTGDRPVTSDPSETRSGRSDHHRPRSDTSWQMPPMAETVRPVSWRVPNSLLALEIGDGNPAKCGLVQSEVTRVRLFRLF
jgi:hypothetical protein